MNTRYHFFLIIFFSVVMYFHSFTQEIKNDTIYTSVSQQTSLYFPSAITFCDYTETDAYTGFTKRIENDMVILYAKVKNPKQAILKINEGRRNHVFIIACKEELSANELAHDWSSVKKLKDYVVLREQKKLNTSQFNISTVQTASSPVVENTPAPAIVLQDTAKDNYDNILLEAYSLLEAKNYAAARKLYVKAASLKPHERIAKNNITEIDDIVDRIAKQEILEKEKLQSDASYKAQISLANTAFNSNNYEDAKVGYSIALSLKPNDPYAKKQLDASQKNLYEIVRSKGKEELETKYISAIETGNAAFSLKNYENAKAGYSLALSFKPNDTYAKKQLDASQKKLNEVVSKGREELEAKYATAIEVGNASFNSKNYEYAKAGYSLALSFKPDDAYAKKQLDASQGKLELEGKYSVAIETGNTALKQSNYEEAKANYSLALSFKPNDPYAKKQLDGSQKKSDEIVRIKAKEELEAKYNSAIESGKAALNQSNYKEAKEAFSEASRLKPLEAYPKAQINGIEKKSLELLQKAEKDRIIKERETAFNDAIAFGNDAYNGGNYMAAKTEYKKGLAIKTDPYATEQLKKIDKIIADSTQRANDEKKNTANYNSNIEKANKAFELKDYANAKRALNQALTFKDDQYAKEKIAEIDNIVTKIAEEAERTKKYDAAVVNGKAAFTNNDFERAKIFFEEASAVRPTEQYAKDQLMVIYKTLDDIAKEKARNDKYDSAIVKASLALQAQAYDIALSNYKDAALFKPEEVYPAKMIMYVEGVKLTLAEQAFKDSVTRKRAIERKQFAVTYQKATQAIFQKRWQEALDAYKEILTLNPQKSEEEFANQKITAITLKLEEIARSIPVAQAPVVIAPKNKREAKEQKRLQEISKILAEENKKVQATSQVSPSLFSQWAIGNPTNEQPAAYKSISSTLQAEAIPYSHDELVKKYPAINFDELPSGQTYDVSDRKNRSQNFQVSNKVLLEAPRLNYSDSSNSVKVTCQGITFSGANAYVKLLIQNDSMDDFLTGALQLKLLKKDSALDLNQRFISDFPVILPKKEYTIIYVADGSLIVDPGDNFILEMNDRMKNISLKINIPGSIYNQQKTASL